MTDGCAAARALSQLVDRALTDDVSERLKTWIDRLVDKLTAIVEKIGKATSSSISVGTGVSVTVTFGPFATDDGLHHLE